MALKSKETTYCTMSTTIIISKNVVEYPQKSAPKSNNKEELYDEFG
jgi:hypothetical protein